MYGKKAFVTGTGTDIGNRIALKPTAADYKSPHLTAPVTSLRPAKLRKLSDKIPPGRAGYSGEIGDICCSSTAPHH